MLAELTTDENIVRCVVITFDADGNVGWGYHDMSRAEMAYAGAVVSRMVFDDIYDDC